MRARVPSCSTRRHGPDGHSLPESYDARSCSSSVPRCSRPNRSTTPVHRNLAASTNATEALACAPSKSRPPGPRHANRLRSNTPQGEEEEEEIRV
ncbi:hypothetical protein MTO96_002215 [Rhipicephalus appendiculatus]